MRRCRPLLGAYVEIAVESDTATAGKAIARAFDAVAEVGRLMSYHDPDSDLSLVNREACGRPVRVHPWTIRVLRAAQRIHSATRGLFDCSVAAALVRDGVLPDHGYFAHGEGSPADIVFSATEVRFNRPMTLDLGGIAKGFAVDRAVAALRHAGIAAGSVNAGGDMRVFGPAAYDIHLRDPADPSRLIRAGALNDGACATSAAYFSRRVVGNRMVCDLIDPRDGASIETARSFTVLAPTCMVADALTKVAALAGSEAARLLAPFRAKALVL